MKYLAAAAAFCAAFLGFSKPAFATASYVCTPAAIHQKYIFTKQLWHKLETSNDNSGLETALDKLWDGNGDCSGNEDTSKFTFSTISELVQWHYWADAMSATWNEAIKQYPAARQQLDDFWVAEGIVQKFATRMPSSFMAEDGEMVKNMRALDQKLTKLGYGAKGQKP